MNGLIGLLILYIIFSLVSSVVRKSKSGKKFPQQKNTTPKDMQAKFEEYVGKLGEFFEQPKVTEQKPPKLKPKKVITVSSGERHEPLSRRELVDQQDQQTLASTDRELEFVLQGSTQRVLQDVSLSKPQRRPRVGKPHVPTETRQSLVAFNKRRSYIQGIILSEILGPPVSKRRYRR